MLQIAMLFWITLVACLGFGGTAEAFSEGFCQPTIKPGEKEPSCANGENYCEAGSIPEYPKDVIINILKDPKERLPSELINFIFHENFNQLNEYVDKSNNSLRQYTKPIPWKESDAQLCRETKTFMTPVAVKTEEHGWQYIVNDIMIKKTDFPQLELSEANYRQSIEIHTCLVGSPLCGKEKGTCEQAYGIIKLLALNSSCTKLYTIEHYYPSCCQCTLKQT